MGKVVADITMSLDGFITGPDDRPGRGLGEGGECLHNWVMGRPWRYDDEGRRFAPADVDRHVLEQAMGSTGAGIIGRRMFDVTGGVRRRKYRDASGAATARISADHAAEHSQMGGSP